MNWQKKQKKTCNTRKFTFTTYTQSAAKQKFRNSSTNCDVVASERVQKHTTLTHTSSVGHWADSGLGFAEPRLSFCSGQTPEVASLPLYWRLHLHSNTETGRTVSKRENILQHSHVLPTQNTKNLLPYVSCCRIIQSVTLGRL